MRGLITFLALFLWLSDSISFKKPSELVVTGFPRGINTVTFENDLVSLNVVKLAYHRDVPFELNFIATCKDREYGSIIGMPHDSHFFFQYENLSKGQYSTAPINDIHGIHPTTKSKEPNKSDMATPRKPSD